MSILPDRGRDRGALLANGTEPVRIWVTDRAMGIGSSVLTGLHRERHPRFGSDLWEERVGAWQAGWWAVSPRGTTRPICGVAVAMRGKTWKGGRTWKVSLGRGEAIRSGSRSTSCIPALQKSVATDPAYAVVGAWAGEFETSRDLTAASRSECKPSMGSVAKLLGRKCPERVHGRTGGSAAEHRPGIDAADLTRANAVSQGSHRHRHRHRHRPCRGYEGVCKLSNVMHGSGRPYLVTPSEHRRLSSHVCIWIQRHRSQFKLRMTNHTFCGQPARSRD